MKLALIFGKKGNDIKPRILQVKDNLVIDCFNSVDDMIANSKQRNYLFDRVILLSTIAKINNNESYILDTLYSYWKDFSPRTNIILLCSSGKDDVLARTFTDLFNSPLCTSMSVQASTMSILQEASTDSILSINAKYGLAPSIDVEVESDMISLPEEPKQESKPSQKELEEQRKKERHEARARERERKAKEKEAKGKKGLFGLFGGNRKNNSQQQNTDIQTVENTQIINQENSVDFDNYDWESQYEENLKGSVVYDGSDEYSESNEEEGVEVDYVPESIPEEFLDEVDNNQEDSDFYNINTEYSSPQNESNISDGFTTEDSDNELNSSTSSDFMVGMDSTEQEEPNDLEDNSSSDFIIGDDSYSNNDLGDYANNSNQDSNQMGYSEEDSDIEDSDDSEQWGSEEWTEDIEESNEPIETDNEQYEESNYSQETYQEDVEEVEEDLSDIDLSMQDFYENQSIQPEDALEVDEELGSIDVGGMDASYRDKAEAPKVIEKVVEREVIKEVNVGGSVLKNVYAGKATKVIVVTGDRGSGVTSLALDIANAFAKHTSVLYFDGDIELHGLLNYIDYDSFREYEEQHMQGVKLCRSSKAFGNCRLRFDDNLDILSTNFGVSVKDEELELTQSVVAEIASSYSVVVVDAPIDKICCFEDLILQGNVVLCVEATKRGFMNMLCKVEDSLLPLRYKRSIVGKGTMVVTKIHPKLNMKQLIKYVKNIVEFDDVDWLSMNIVPRDANITDKFLSEIIEG